MEMVACIFCINTWFLFGIMLGRRAKKGGYRAVSEESCIRVFFHYLICIILMIVSYSLDDCAVPPDCQADRQVLPVMGKKSNDVEFKTVNYLSLAKFN